MKDDLVRRGDVLRSLRAKCMDTGYNGLTWEDARKAVNRVPAAVPAEQKKNQKDPR